MSISIKIIVTGIIPEKIGELEQTPDIHILIPPIAKESTAK